MAPGLESSSGRLLMVMADRSSGRPHARPGSAPTSWPGPPREWSGRRGGHGLQTGGRVRAGGIWTRKILRGRQWWGWDRVCATWAMFTGMMQQGGLPVLFIHFLACQRYISHGAVLHLLEDKAVKTWSDEGVPSGSWVSSGANVSSRWGDCKKRNGRENNLEGAGATSLVIQRHDSSIMVEKNASVHT